MRVIHVQATLDPFGPVISSPGDDARLIPGPLQLRDRTVWWTGRVAIGIRHERRSVPPPMEAGAVDAAGVLHPLFGRINTWLYRCWS